MIVPLAGAISLVRASCVRARSTVASAARNWARAASMSSGRGPLIASVSAACVWSTLARPASSAMRASSSSCLVEALLRGQVLLPRERRLGVGERGLRGGEIGARLVDVFRPRAGDQQIELCLGGIAPRRGQIGGALVGGGVEFGDRLALLHPVAFALRHGDDGALGVERRGRPGGSPRCRTACLAAPSRSSAARPASRRRR